jgi:hypothetical protein
LGGISDGSPEPLRKVFQHILSIAFGIGQLRQKSRTRFPGDFAPVIEAAHRISAFLVSPQDLRQQLLFGDVVMVRLYLVVGDVHPELECTPWSGQVGGPENRLTEPTAESHPCGISFWPRG